MPFPTPDDLPDPGIESWSSALQEDSLPSEPLEKPLEMHTYNLLKSCIYFFLLVEEVLPVSLLRILLPFKHILSQCFQVSFLSPRSLIFH